MGEIRCFHMIYGGAHELSSNPFPRERGLQTLFEKHLHTLTGIRFLASEYSTGPRHSRRIDTLGLDEAGRPVVIEYKRNQDDNVINQGLDYLDWLADHRAEFRELVRDKLGGECDIDVDSPRLLCVASDFPRQDEVAAKNSRRPIDLVRYRRYGDDFILLEWVYARSGAGIATKPKPAKPGPDSTRNASPGPTGESTPRPAEPTDYSIYKNWDKTDDNTRDLFRKLDTWMKSLGNVRTDVFKSEISFKYTDAPGKRPPVVAYVDFRVRGGLLMGVWEKYVRDIPIEDGFTRSLANGRGGGPLREITIRNEEHIRKAEPLLRAAWDHLSKRRP